MGEFPTLCMYKTTNGEPVWTKKLTDSQNKTDRWIRDRQTDRNQILNTGQQTAGKKRTNQPKERQTDRNEQTDRAKYGLTARKKDRNV